MLGQVVTPAGDRLLSRGPDEVAGRLLITRAQDDRRVRSRRDVFLEAAADLHELRQTLHGKQKGALGSARRLQDLSEVAVAERRKLVEHDAEQRPVRLSPLLVAFVALADNELQILKKHLAESANRLGIFVHVERDKQDQFLFDDIVDRQQIL